MKYQFGVSILLFFVWFSLSCLSADEFQSEFVTTVHHKSCQHGLVRQPQNGPFSVFVFCDDALGSNIGLILAEPGAGPGKLKLEGTKSWGWLVYNRFWQNQQWSSDVTSFAWDPNFRFLYVATSGVYGNGSLFKLDLENKEYEKLLPNKASKYYDSLKDKGFRTRIVDLDVNSGILTVAIELYWPEKKTVATEKINLK